MSPKSSSNPFLEWIDTKNQHYLKILEKVKKVVDLDVPVLLLGESGVGKDRLAEAMHHISSRNNEPFLKISCPNLPEDLFESELFGYEKGAFTDAYEARAGKMEMAGKGTIYLDEIVAIPLHVQAKLLRVIEEKKFMRLGGTRPRKLEARIVASTNQPLLQLIREGKFRSDLYYRLNVLIFRIPPLRDRRDDIPMLAKRFLVQSAKRWNRRICGFTRDALRLLQYHTWKGNVRELMNVVERAVILCTNEERIRPEHLPTHAIFALDDLMDRGVQEMWSLKELEKVYIERILRLTGNNVSRSARILGISRKTLIDKKKKYGL